MAVTALYVHVPFCAQKCRYCDFDSRSFAPCDLSAALDAYFEQLYARLDAFGDVGALAQIRTVYVGGGTPSLAGDRRAFLWESKPSTTPSLPPSAAFTMPIGRSLPSRLSRTLGLTCRAT